MTGKTYECYWQVFNWLQSEVPDMDEVFSVGVDFEQAFFTVVKEYFPEAWIIGCYFHFKQALLKKMKALQIPENQRMYANRKGKLDILTVLPKDQIEAGILFVKHDIVEYVKSLEDSTEAHLKKWDEFFDDYFCE